MVFTVQDARNIIECICHLSTCKSFSTTIIFEFLCFSTISIQSGDSLCAEATVQQSNAWNLFRYRSLDLEQLTNTFTHSNTVFQMQPTPSCGTKNLSLQTRTRCWWPKTFPETILKVILFSNYLVLNLHNFHKYSLSKTNSQGYAII